MYTLGSEIYLVVHPTIILHLYIAELPIWFEKAPNTIFCSSIISNFVYNDLKLVTIFVKADLAWGNFRYIEETEHQD